MWSPYQLSLIFIICPFDFQNTRARVCVKHKFANDRPLYNTYKLHCDNNKVLSISSKLRIVIRMRNIPHYRYTIHGGTALRFKKSFKLLLLLLI